MSKASIISRLVQFCYSCILNIFLVLRIENFFLGLQIKIESGGKKKLLKNKSNLVKSVLKKNFEQKIISADLIKIVKCLAILENGKNQLTNDKLQHYDYTMTIFLDNLLNDVVVNGQKSLYWYLNYLKNNDANLISMIKTRNNIFEIFNLYYFEAKSLQVKNQSPEVLNFNNLQSFNCFFSNIVIDNTTLTKMNKKTLCHYIDDTRMIISLLQVPPPYNLNNIENFFLSLQILNSYDYKQNMLNIEIKYFHKKYFNIFYENILFQYSTYFVYNHMNFMEPSKLKYTNPQLKKIFLNKKLSFKSLYFIIICIIFICLMSSFFPIIELFFLSLMFLIYYLYFSNQYFLTKNFNRTFIDKKLIFEKFLINHYAITIFDDINFFKKDYKEFLRKSFSEMNDFSLNVEQKISTINDEGYEQQTAYDMKTNLQKNFFDRHLNELLIFSISDLFTNNIYSQDSLDIDADYSNELNFHSEFTLSYELFFEDMVFQEINIQSTYFTKYLINIFWHYKKNILLSAKLDVSFFNHFTTFVMDDSEMIEYFILFLKSVDLNQSESQIDMSNVNFFDLLDYEPEQYSIFKLFLTIFNDLKNLTPFTLSESKKFFQQINIYDKNFLYNWLESRRQEEITNDDLTVSLEDGSIINLISEESFIDEGKREKIHHILLDSVFFYIKYTQRNLIVFTLPDFLVNQFLISDVNKVKATQFLSFYNSQNYLQKKIYKSIYSEMIKEKRYFEKIYMPYFRENFSAIYLFQQLKLKKYPQWILNKNLFFQELIQRYMCIIRNLGKQPQVFFEDKDCLKSMINENLFINNWMNLNKNYTDFFAILTDLETNNYTNENIFFDEKIIQNFLNIINNNIFEIEFSFLNQAGEYKTHNSLKKNIFLVQKYLYYIQTISYNTFKHHDIQNFNIFIEVLKKYHIFFKNLKNTINLDIEFFFFKFFPYNYCQKILYTEYKEKIFYYSLISYYLQKYKISIFLKSNNNYQLKELYNLLRNLDIYTNQIYQQSNINKILFENYEVVNENYEEKIQNIYQILFFSFLYDSRKEEYFTNQLVKDYLSLDDINNIFAIDDFKFFLFNEYELPYYSDEILTVPLNNKSIPIPTVQQNFYFFSRYYKNFFFCDIELDYEISGVFFF